MSKIALAERVFMDEELKTVQEVSKAVQEASKATGKTVEVLQAAGSYIGEALGSLPADVVGVAGGDWLREVRVRNTDRLRRRTDEILDQRDTRRESIQVSPSILIPIAAAASEESRDELQELFARLLANAADPEREGRVRRQFIEIVMQMEPIDARLFVLFGEAGDFTDWAEQIKLKIPEAPVGSASYKAVENIVRELGKSWDEIDLAVGNLEGLKCIQLMGNSSKHRNEGVLRDIARHFRKHNQMFDDELLPESLTNVEITLLGRELMRSLEL